MAEQAKVNVTAMQTGLNTSKSALNKVLNSLEPLMEGPSADAKQLSSTGIQKVLPKIVETMNTIKGLLSNDKLIEAKDDLNKMRKDLKDIKSDFKKYKPTKNNYKKAALDTKKAIGEVLGETKKISTSLRRVKDLEKTAENTDLTPYVDRLKKIETYRSVRDQVILREIDGAIKDLKDAQASESTATKKSKISSASGKVGQARFILGAKSKDPFGQEKLAQAKEELEDLAFELNNLKIN